MTNSLKKTAEELLKQHTGRGGWNVRSARAQGGKLTVRYTDLLAELGYQVSPEMNRKPTVRTGVFDIPTRAAT
jgi:hypothetical protein